MKLTRPCMSSYSHTNEQHHYFLHARYPQRRGPSSRETSSVGFNLRVNRRQRVRTNKEVDGKKIFSLARATNLSLSRLPFFPRNLLISHDGTLAIPCENTILLESLVSGVRACARALSELESRGQTLSARPKSRTLLLDEGTGICEREPHRRSDTKRRDVSD